MRRRASIRRLRAVVKRPSPAMLVALTALFVSMSGTTYAVTRLPARSVGSIQLKKGAVRSANIADGAVTATKLSAGLSAAKASTSSRASLRAETSYATRAGYADKAGRADLATLADTATTATSATNATSAGSATSAAMAGNAAKLDGKDPGFFLPRSTIVDVPRFSLGPDEQRVMLTHGPFTFTARCYIGLLAGDEAEILISTTQAHSAFEGFGQDPDLNPGDPEITRSVVAVDGTTGQPQFESSADGTALAPDGTEIRSIVFYTGLNLFGQVGRCTFGGFAII
jgi:hypothetical protein